MSNCCNEFEFSSPQGTFYMDGGIRGKDGVTYYPHVSADGVLSWTNDGGKPNPDPVNIKGADGKDGADGKSAYAAAKEAGFTGTEAEFNTWLSGIGNLSEDVSDLKSVVGAYENIFDGAYASRTGNVTNVTVSGATYTLVTNGGSIGRVIFYSSTPIADTCFEPGKTYTIEFASSDSDLLIDLYYKADSSTNTRILSDSPGHYYVDIPANAATILFRITVPAGKSGTITANVKVFAGERSYTPLIEAVDDLKSQINTKASAIYDTASGAIASFDDGEDDMPLKALTVNVEPVQSGSGDPSPENMRPITGWTGCNVARTGKNLLNAALTYQYNNNTVRIGANNNDFVLRFPAGQYTFSCSFLNDVHYGLFMQYEGGSNIALIGSNSSADAATFTLENKPIRMWFYGSSGVSMDNVANIQMEQGQSVTDYEPYQGETYPVTFPTDAGMVYGGMLDVVNKKLTVDRVGVKIKDINWTYDGTTYYRFTVAASKLPYAPQRAPSQYTPPDGLMCECYAIHSANGLSDKQLAITNAGTILLKDTSYTTQDALKVGVGEYLIVYALADPIEILLTDVPEVTTFLGLNNIWADCGDVSVEYAADTKLYIDNKIAAAIAAALNA